MLGATEMYGTEPRLVGGRYEIGPVLGYGGMAEVYRGHDVRLGREVAVKTLRADLARDPTFHTRFRREAQSAAALNHPAIVSVYDTGEDVVNGVTVPYIVMEYIEGRTLREVVQDEGRFTERRALEITADVCAALDYSHRMGIIHRDIKPANVMLTPNGSIKVMDFGIARATAGSTSTMTQTAQVIGTAQYLSPEQARGETVDARSDVYSTGVFLYELLTGNPPFRGDSPVAVAYQHVREMPQPPSMHDPDITPEADAIVFKAMAKSREERYQSAGEMQDDIERALAGRRVIAPLLAAGGTTAMMAGPGGLGAQSGATQRIAPGSYGDPTARYGNTGYQDQYDGYGPPTGQFADDYPDEYAGGPNNGGAAANWWKYALAALGVVLLFVVVFLVAKSALGGGSGGSKVTIPNDLVNKNFAGAETELTDLSLQSKVVRANSATVPQDSVISSDPAGGSTVKKNSTVTLTVSSGLKKVLVPNVVNLQQAAAIAQLTASGFKYTINQVPGTPGQPAGLVTAMDPQAFTSQPAGTSIQLNVVNGNGTIQDFTNQTYQAAAQGLQKLGFTNLNPQYVSSDKPAGTVLSQTPNSGQVPLSTQITLTVAQAATPSPTPSATATSPSPSGSPSPSPTDTGIFGNHGLLSPRAQAP
ncbi:MAG: Stk1 family PASTA domain-containing Ser/Thr kinase [Frankia sp.]